MWNVVFVLCFVIGFEVSNCALPGPLQVQANEVNLTLNGSDTFYWAKYNFSAGDIVKFHFFGRYVWTISLPGFPDILTTPKAVNYDLILTLKDDYDGKYVECQASPYNGVGAKISIQIYLSKVEDALSNSTRGRANNSYDQFIAQYIKEGYPEIKNITSTKISALHIRKYRPETRKILAISYDYDYGEDLYLSCIPEHSKETLHFNYTVSCVEEETLTKVYKCKLLPDERTGLIWCENTNSKGNIAELTLVKIRDKVTSTPDRDETTATPDAASRNTNIKGGTQERIQKRGIGIKLWITIAVCSLIFLLVLIFISMQLCKKKPKPRKLLSDSHVSYDNVHQDQNQNETTIVPPSNQWQEAQYATPTDRVQHNEDYATPFTPNLAEMYATPVPKSKRLLKTTNKQEDDTIYANDNAGYTPEVTYANDIPKHASNDNLTKESKRPRKGVAVMPNVTYAEIQSKNPKQKSDKTQGDYSNVLGNSYHPYDDIKNEDEYVDVAGSSYEEPGNRKPKGYVNVFKGSKYVNSSEKSDYAEPAYYQVQE